MNFVNQIRGFVLCRNKIQIKISLFNTNITCLVIQKLGHSFSHNSMMFNQVKADSVHIGVRSGLEKLAKLLI